MRRTIRVHPAQRVTTKVVVRWVLCVRAFPKRMGPASVAADWNLAQGAIAALPVEAVGDAADLSVELLRVPDDEGQSPRIMDAPKALIGDP